MSHDIMVTCKLDLIGRPETRRCYIYGFPSLLVEQGRLPTLLIALRMQDIRVVP
jgi:hypothetical protein